MRGVDLRLAKGMNSFAIAAIAFVCIFGGALLGFLIQSFLPEHHLSAASKDSVKLGAGLIATMAALLLGLLVASSKSTFDSVNTSLMQMGAKTILLDRALANYGPEANPAREALKNSISSALQTLWPEESKTKANKDDLKTIEHSQAMENVTDMVSNLNPQTERQKHLQAKAVQLCSDLMLSRWLMIEQQQSVMPIPLLVVALFWLAMLNVTFGLFAPRNLTVIAVLLACAISVSGAIFLLVEMDSPLSGSIKVSSGPVHKALEDIGR